MGVAGTVISATTALTLDFNKQTVGINLDVSIRKYRSNACNTRLECPNPAGQ